MASFLEQHDSRDFIPPPFRTANYQQAEVSALLSVESLPRGNCKIGLRSFRFHISAYQVLGCRLLFRLGIDAQYFDEPPDLFQMP